MAEPINPWVEIAVLGKPQPAGSKTATAIRRKDGTYVMKNGRIVTAVFDSNKGAKSWMHAVRQAAEMVWGDNLPWDGPIEVQFVFLRARPDSHFSKRKGHERELLASAADQWDSTPDTTKLIRCAEDALTGVCWTNDSRIHKQIGVKAWSTYDGAIIRLRRSDEVFDFDADFTRILRTMEEIHEQHDAEAGQSYF